MGNRKQEKEEAQKKAEAVMDKDGTTSSGSSHTSGDFEDTTSDSSTAKPRTKGSESFEKSKRHREAGLSSDYQPTKLHSNNPRSNYNPNRVKLDSPQEYGYVDHSSGGSGKGSDIQSNVHNESFNADIAVSNSIMDEKYLHVSGDHTIGDPVETYNKDNFVAGGGSITDALATLDNINNGVANAEYFYHLYGENKDVIEGVIADLTNFKESKMAMTPDPVNEAGGKYNDDLESAKNLQYYKYLETVADEYNANPKKLYDFVEVYDQITEKSSDPNVPDKSYWRSRSTASYYGGGGFNTNLFAHVSDDTLIKDTPSYGHSDSRKAGDEYYLDSNTKVKVTGCKYDEIKYYFGFQGWNSVFDMAFYNKQTLMKKLDGRHLSYTKMEERPSYSFYGGSGSGSGSGDFSGGGGSHSF